MNEKFSEAERIAHHVNSALGHYRYEAEQEGKNLLRAMSEGKSWTEFISCLGRIELYYRMALKLEEIQKQSK